MYKHLYEIFKHWYCVDGIHQNSIYIIGDTHFSDLDCYKLRFPNLFQLKYQFVADIIDVYKKYNVDIFEALSSITTPLKTSEQSKDLENEKRLVELLDNLQINSINKLCTKKDALIVLGDVGNIQCVKKLKAGYKILILGNHDRGASYYKRIIEHEAVSMKMTGLDNTPITLNKEGKIIEDNHLFDEVYEGTLQIGQKIILSHEPVDYPYCLNIHGHDHTPQITAFKEHIHATHTSYSYNCCAEHVGYKPICINKFFINNGIFSLSKVLDIHRKTIDTAIKRKNRRGRNHE